MSLESTREFIQIAERQGMLSTELLRDLRDESIRSGIDGQTLAIQRGLLTPLEVEIIETLRQPLAAIPGYEILSVLGHGGMGVVYRAKQLALDRLVALKTIHVRHSINPSSLARFEMEAQTVARLVHPHIIAAYDFGEHSGRVYFAMEYVEGEDAEQYVRRQHPLSERQVWLLIRQAVAGLAHAAEAGIVHRDIKPANLLLVAPPQGFPLPPGAPLVKIADFGLAFLSAEAEEQTRLTSEQSTVGSPHYMAPEQFDADTPVDLRADIYSLGASTFHLLTSHPPFDGRSLPQIIAAKLSDEFPSLREARADVSPETELLIRRMTARDVTQRIENYAELLARIDSLPSMNNDRTTTAAHVSAIAETPAITTASQRLRSWKGLALAGTAALLVMGVVIGLNSFHAAPPQTPASFLAETGWAAELFDGQSLRGWKVQSGAWTTGLDEERRVVLAGTDGEILRPLLKPVDDRSIPLTHYRLTVTARLHAASAIELHFENHDGPRGAVRLTLDRIAIGYRASKRAEFVPFGDAKPFEIGAEHRHEIRVETGDTWHVFLDGTEIGTLPFSPRPALPEFRLVAEGGPAWFGDVFVEELDESQSAGTHAATR
jgi:eukaryotic-like serine/threonine-protein kinase